MIFFAGCYRTTVKENITDDDKQGYEADHKDIKLLRLKNFTLGRKLEDSEITAADSLQRIADFIGSMAPFVRFQRFVLSTFDFLRVFSRLLD